MTPRSNRYDSALNLYNVLICSNNSESIFKDEYDKMFMKELILKDSCNSFKVYAYSILDDKANFLITPTDGNLSAIMKRINMTYAMYYNRKYARSGHVFHDRYKSRSIDNEELIGAVIRSIHEMPVLEGYCNMCDEYKFSSYRIYKQLGKNAEYVDVQGYAVSLNSILRENSCYEYMDKCFSDVGKIACKIIDEFYCKHNINENILKQKDSEGYRRELVILIRSNTGYSIRKISELLNINRGEVYKFISPCEEDKK